MNTKNEVIGGQLERFGYEPWTWRDAVRRLFQWMALMALLVVAVVWGADYGLIWLATGSAMAGVIAAVCSVLVYAVWTNDPTE